LEGLLHLSEMRDGSLKEPYSYVKKGDRLWLRISHLEPEKRRVGFTERWGTDSAETTAPSSVESSANGVHGKGAAQASENADAAGGQSDAPAAENAASAEGKAK
jgi:transcriptional accessory protein Tex/SPT6